MKLWKHSGGIVPSLINDISFINNLNANIETKFNYQVGTWAIKHRNEVLPRLNTTLRNWEYYGMQDTFDDLYKRSKEGESFNNLYELITSRENILLAYRTIKSNKGSKTEGTDKITIDNIKAVNEEEFVEIIRKVLVNYKPKSVRRVLIPKANGKKRPLGIPSMRDRLIQQMFKQILEPIAEAKFFNHSYGFSTIKENP